MANLETILSWFQTGDNPTEEEFRQTFSSFRHNDTKIPITDVDGLESSLNNKLSLDDIPNVQGDTAYDKQVVAQFDGIDYKLGIQNRESSQSGIPLTGTDQFTGAISSPNYNLILGKLSGYNSQIFISDSNNSNYPNCNFNMSGNIGEGFTVESHMHGSRSNITVGYGNAAMQGFTKSGEWKGISVSGEKIIFSNIPNATGDATFSNQIVMKANGIIGYEPKPKIVGNRTNTYVDYTTRTSGIINDSTGDVVAVFNYDPETIYAVDHTGNYSAYYILPESGNYNADYAPYIKAPEGKQISINTRTDGHLFLNGSDTYQLKNSKLYMVVYKTINIVKIIEL